MYGYLLSDEALKLREEVRDYVKSVPRELFLAMDREEVRFPKEFLKETGRRNLMGCRYPKEWGGRGQPVDSKGCVGISGGTHSRFFHKLPVAGR